jgi:hypothetical protein
MKIRKARKKVNAACNTALTPTINCEESENKWMQAAENARLKIADHKKKIRLLEEAARIFEEHAKAGQRWPQRVSQ